MDASAQRDRAGRLGKSRDAARGSAAGGEAREKNGRRVLQLRREIAAIEKGIAELTARRTAVEEELCKDPMNQALQTEYATLNRDTASMESRWMEVGAAIEAAEP